MMPLCTASACFIWWKQTNEEFTQSSCCCTLAHSVFTTSKYACPILLRALPLDWLQARSTVFICLGNPCPLQQSYMDSWGAVKFPCAQIDRGKNLSFQHSREPACCKILADFGCLWPVGLTALYGEHPSVFFAIGTGVHDIRPHGMMEGPI